jgi:hypothetical protein
MPELEITGDRLRTLNEESVGFYLGLDNDARQIAMIYGVGVAKVEKVVAQVRRREAQEKARLETLDRLTRMAMGGRPVPPAEMVDPRNPAELFAPSPEMSDWVRSAFLERGGPLYNAGHSHLRDAEIGFLWTNVLNARQMRPVAGQAEIPRGQGGKWSKARHDFQMRRWFGDVPDFLITLDAGYWIKTSDASACALADHELYHCAQAVDMWGEPRFDLEDRPVFCLKGHDVEEFVGVVERFGVGAAAAGVAGLVRAASRKPLIGAADIAGACGNCMKR